MPKLLCLLLIGHVSIGESIVYLAIEYKENGFNLKWKSYEQRNQRPKYASHETVHVKAWACHKLVAQNEPNDFWLFCECVDVTSLLREIIIILWTHFTWHMIEAWNCGYRSLYPPIVCWFACFFFSRKIRICKVV